MLPTRPKLDLARGLVNGVQIGAITLGYYLWLHAGYYYTTTLGYNDTDSKLRVTCNIYKRHASDSVSRDSGEDQFIENKDKVKILVS